MFYFASMIAFIVMCGPKDGQSQYSYLSALASDQCTRTHPLIIMTGVVNVASDLYLIVLPLPAVWALNLPLRRKVGISAIFLTGSMYELPLLKTFYQVANKATVPALPVYLDWCTEWTS